MMLKSYYFNGILIFFFYEICYMLFNEILHIFYKTALYQAIENENMEIIKLLLLCDRLNINTYNI